MALIKMMAAPNTRMHASVKGVEKAWEDENGGVDNEENNILIAMEVAKVQQQKKMRSTSSRSRRRWAAAVGGTQVLEGNIDTGVDEDSDDTDGDAGELDASFGAYVTEASEHGIESALDSSSAIVGDCSSVLKNGRTRRNETRQQSMSANSNRRQ
jgi:hypothetical protein